MANEGHVIQNATVTVNGVDISGTLNQTEVRMRRDEISWIAYSDDAMSKAGGVRDEQIRFRGLYSAGTAAAFDTLFDLYAGTNGGTMGTISVGDSITSGGTFTCTAKITELTANLNKGEVGVIDCVFGVHGTIAYSIA